MPIPFRSGLTIAIVTLALGAVTLVGCDSAGSSNDGSDVEVGFSSTSTSSTSSAASLAKSNHQLVVGGANGDTLRINEIGFIVTEVELEADADSLESDSAEFETERPFFVDLPLSSADPVPALTDRVPPGRYNEFEFDVEGVDLDDDEVSNDLQNEINNWPSGASMVVVGRFGSNDKETKSFTAYLDAEIEGEIEMDRLFEVGGSDSPRALTVNLRPSSWFSKNDGNPRNLSAPDYQNPDDPAELEIEVEQESEVEFDD